MSKTDILNALKKECEELSGGVSVFGEGNPESPIVFIGEAPGEKEAEAKRPFVGKAGKNLDTFLELLELRREDIYITNLVKVRPYKVNPNTGRKSNRPPNRKEIELYSPILMRELACIAPRLIVTLGNYALKAVAGDPSAVIGDMHGRTIKVSPGGYDTVLFPMYHPASIIYRRELESVYENDLKLLKAYFFAK